MANYKVRVQLYDDDGTLMGDADVQTIAELVYFADGQTFQDKLDNGTLKGPAGATGPQGQKGATGALYLGKVTVCKNAVSIKPPRYGY